MDVSYQLQTEQPGHKNTISLRVKPFFLLNVPLLSIAAPRCSCCTSGFDQGQIKDTFFPLNNCSLFYIPSANSVEESSA